MTLHTHKFQLFCGHDTTEQKEQTQDTTFRKTVEEQDKITCELTHFLPKCSPRLNVSDVFLRFLSFCLSTGLGPGAEVNKTPWNNFPRWRIDRTMNLSTGRPKQTLAGRKQMVNTGRESKTHISYYLHKCDQMRLSSTCDREINWR